MPSEWTYHASLSNYDSLIFDKAIGNPDDYTYKPIVIAKQLTNGINYRVICIAHPKSTNGKPHFAMVAVHKPLNEAGYVTAIHPIEPFYN